MVYIAAAPGVGQLGNGKLLSAGRSTEKPYSAFTKSIFFTSPDASDTLHLKNPVVLASLQTSNLDAATILRNIAFISDDKDAVTGMRVKRQVDTSNKEAVKNDKSPSADVVGWIVLSDDDGTSDIDNALEDVPDVEVVNRVIRVNGPSDYNVYSMNGVLMNKNAVLEPGVYLVRSGRRTVKVFVR